MILHCGRSREIARFIANEAPNLKRLALATALCARFPDLECAELDAGVLAAFALLQRRIRARDASEAPRRRSVGRRRTRTL